MAAPVIEQVGNAFGQTRGWSELTISFENAIEEIPDSNELNGVRIEEGDLREVSVSGTIDSDDGDPDFDFQNIVATTAQTDDLSFQVGDDGVALGSATAVALTLGNLNLQELTPAQPARSKANTFSAFATGTTDGAELTWENR